MGVNKLDIKECLDFMLEHTLLDKVRDIITLVNRTGAYNYFVEIISNGNGMSGLRQRARDEKMNYYFFLEQVFINKYDEIFEKIGD